MDEDEAKQVDMFPEEHRPPTVRHIGNSRYLPVELQRYIAERDLWADQVWNKRSDLEYCHLFAVERCRVNGHPQLIRNRANIILATKEWNRSWSDRELPQGIRLQLMYRGEGKVVVNPINWIRWVFITFLPTVQEWSLENRQALSEAIFRVSRETNLYELAEALILPIENKVFTLMEISDEITVAIKEAVSSLEQKEFDIFKDGVAHFFKPVYTVLQNDSQFKGVPYVVKEICKKVQSVIDNPQQYIDQHPDLAAWAKIAPPLSEEDDKTWH